MPAVTLLGDQTKDAAGLSKWRLGVAPTGSLRYLASHAYSIGQYVLLDSCSILLHIRILKSTWHLIDEFY